MGRPGSVLGASWGRLGAAMGRLGASWERLGGVLGRLGSVLGRLAYTPRKSSEKLSMLPPKSDPRNLENQ